MIRSDQPYSLHGRILIVARAASCAGRHGIGIRCGKKQSEVGGGAEVIASVGAGVRLDVSADELKKLERPLIDEPSGHGSTAQEPFDFDRYGVRVPTVVVSPYIEAGTVFRSPSLRTRLRCRAPRVRRAVRACG